MSKLQINFFGLGDSLGSMKEGGSVLLSLHGVPHYLGVVTSVEDEAGGKRVTLSAAQVESDFDPSIYDDGDMVKLDATNIPLNYDVTVKPVVFDVTAIAAAQPRQNAPVRREKRPF